MKRESYEYTPLEIYHAIRTNRPDISFDGLRCSANITSGTTLERRSIKLSPTSSGSGITRRSK